MFQLSGSWRTTTVVVLIHVRPIVIPVIGVSCLCHLVCIGERGLFGRNLCIMGRIANVQQTSPLAHARCADVSSSRFFTVVPFAATHSVLYSRPSCQFT